MTHPDISALCERLRHAHGRAGSYQGDDYIREVGREAADTIERMESENAHLIAKMAEMVTMLSEAKLAQVYAEGTLKMSETAGVVKGWMERCTRAEARVAKLGEVLIQCAEWFHEYGKMHQAKSALDRAKRNFERAKFALDALEQKP